MFSSSSFLNRVNERSTLWGPKVAECSARPNMARQPQPSDNPIFLTLAARSVLLDSFLSFLLLYFASCGAASHGRRAVEFIHSSKLPSLPIVNKSKHRAFKQASSYNGYIPRNKVQNALLLPCFPFDSINISDTILSDHNRFDTLLSHFLHHYTCKHKLLS